MFHCILTSVGIFLSFCLAAQSQSRCFQFTWLGNSYNSTSVYQNATCADVTKLASGVPCQHPLVVSYDGSWPDVKYIWEHYPEASCVLDEQDVCAQFTYYFDGVALNSTYFCTRAVDSLGNAIRSGCHQQVNGSSVSKVCFCRTESNGMPCNKSVVPNVNYVTVILITIAFILQCFVNMK